MGRGARVALVVTLVCLAGATAVAPVAAQPDDQGPPSGEPSLFVIRGKARAIKGTLTVRADTVEWFTDRPAREAGSMTPKAFDAGWDEWGFATDPPNAALGGGKVDAIGVLNDPRVKGTALTFDVNPLRGTIPDGKLGEISLFVDPTEGAPQYSLTVVNSSSQFVDMALYQKPGIAPRGAVPVVWKRSRMFPDTQNTLTWDDSSQFVWAKTVFLKPGLIFHPPQMLPADPAGESRGIGFTFDGGTFDFVPQGAPGPVGSLTIDADGTVPEYWGSVGVGQSGSAAIVVQAEPDERFSFSPPPREIWLTAGTFEVGQVLDVTEITNQVAIVFNAGVTHLTATLQADNTWALSPG